MKKHNTYLFLLLILILQQNIFAQAPGRFNYQAVVRDAEGHIVANAVSEFRITIYDGAFNGSMVYQETHSSISNQFGLVSFEIGGGEHPTADFSSIDWSSGDKFIQIELDLGNGMVSLGSMQLLSVPYAMYANEAKPSVRGQHPGDMMMWNGMDWVLIPAGSQGQTLTMCNGIPQWGPCTLPVLVSTLSPSDVTAVSVMSGGTISCSQGDTVTDRGLCWGTSPHPDLADQVLHCGSGSGTFQHLISGLIPWTLYYVRSFAVDASGVIYGNEVSFTTLMQ